MSGLTGKGLEKANFTDKRKVHVPAVKSSASGAIVVDVSPQGDQYEGMHVRTWFKRNGTTTYRRSAKGVRFPVHDAPAIIEAIVQAYEAETGEKFPATGLE